MVLSVESQKNPNILLKPCGSGLDSCQLRKLLGMEITVAYQNATTHLVSKKKESYLGFQSFLFILFPMIKEVDSQY